MRHIGLSNKEYQYYIHLIELSNNGAMTMRWLAKTHLFIQDPLFNSMLIASNNSLIRLGKMLNEKNEMVSPIGKLEPKCQNAMNQKLYDHEQKGYVYYDLRNQRIIPSSFLQVLPRFLLKFHPCHVPTNCWCISIRAFSGYKTKNYLCAFSIPKALFSIPKNIGGSHLDQSELAYLYGYEKIWLRQRGWTNKAGYAVFYWKIWLLRIFWTQQRD